jgi:amino acid transporter
MKDKDLKLKELIAIALGGMVGGGIFSILGISVEQIGNATPVAILIGGLLALCAAYSYVKLAGLYKDEGATYSFFKRTFPNSHFASSAIGWLIMFGYISTLALYAFTFSSYFCSLFTFADLPIWRNLTAAIIMTLFVIINLVSVKGMGEIEDILVYTKLVLLIAISAILMSRGSISNVMPVFAHTTTLSGVITVAAITFVAYEGFQLVISAYNEVERPLKNIPRAIYSSIGIAIVLYIILALGAIATIPKEMLIRDKEYALASGAHRYLGAAGNLVVMVGALLATSSAISGTLFGASRLMAVIATDGYLPRVLAHRIRVHIPDRAIITMGIFALVLIFSGGLNLILEFGSMTFILVSLLMALSNFKMRRESGSSTVLALIAMAGLAAAAIFIVYFEATHAAAQLVSILGIYCVLIAGAYVYARRKSNLQTQ